MSKTAITQEMPQNLEAEQAVLGCMILVPEALAKGIKELSASDFYRPSHSLIFSALKSLADQNKPVDLLLLVDRLKSKSKLDDAGGAEYLMSLMDTIPLIQNYEQYSVIVQEKSMLRQIITAGMEISSLGYTSDMASVDVLEKAQKTVFALKSRRLSRVRTFSEVMFNVWDKINGYTEAPLQGIGFGLDKLDRLTNGVLDNELVLIGGRPSAGKTVLALHLVRTAARMGKRPLIFSQETTTEKLTERLLFFEARVNARRARAGELNGDDWDRLSNAAGEPAFGPDNVFCSDVKVTISQLCAIAREYKATQDIGMVVVDYLQIVKASRKHENRTYELGYILEDLAGLKTELGVPVVVLTQLSRAHLDREDKLPDLRDLRDGGGQEAEADKVILIHNPPNREDTDEDQIQPRDAVFVVAKYKDGPTGKVPAKYVGEYTRFIDMATWYDETDSGGKSYAPPLTASRSHPASRRAVNEMED